MKFIAPFMAFAALTATTSAQDCRVDVFGGCKYIKAINAEAVEAL